MWVFARRLPPTTCVLAPRGLHQVPTGGHSWGVPTPGQSGGSSLQMLQPAAASLLSLIDTISASLHIDDSEFDVMGFSQGAALAGTLAFFAPTRIGKTVVLAGFVPNGLEVSSAQRPLVGKEFLVVHGLQDDLISIERARQSIRVLEAAGARVQTCEADVGHRVGAACFRSVERFLRS